MRVNCKEIISALLHHLGILIFTIQPLPVEIFLKIIRQHQCFSTRLPLLFGSFLQQKVSVLSLLCVSLMNEIDALSFPSSLQSSCFVFSTSRNAVFGAFGRVPPPQSEQWCPQSRLGPLWQGPIRFLQARCRCPNRWAADVPIALTVQHVQRVPLGLLPPAILPNGLPVHATVPRDAAVISPDSVTATGSHSFLQTCTE